MRKLTRLAIIGGASALALSLSAPALAAFTPRLDVSVPTGLLALVASGARHFTFGPAQPGGADYDDESGRMGPARVDIVRDGD